MRLANLDGLRFIAASTVVLAHVEVAKKKAGLPAWGGRFFDNSAQLAVTFFFVLSGFFICRWLLCNSDGNNRQIAYRKFYVYRISRTGPLYFGLVALLALVSLLFGAGMSPIESRQFLYYSLMMPNMVNWCFGANDLLAPSWSLAVEESFYLLFPLMLRGVENRKLIKYLIGCTAASMLVAFLLHPAIALQWAKGTEGNVFSFFADRYRFYAFSAGALVAVICLQYPHRLATIRQARFLLLPLFVLALFLGGITFSFITQQVYSLLFAASLLILVLHNKPLPLLSHPWVVLGGRVSFGIYLLHMLLVKPAVALLQQYTFPVLLMLLLGPVILLSVLPLAYVIYHFFELPLTNYLRRQLILKKD